MLSLIAAVNSKGVIGKGGNLPWHDSDDLRRFKRLTDYQTLIVGRKTYESLPTHKFYNRKLVVISESPVKGTENYSFEDAIARFPDAFIIGGESIYKQAIDSGLVKYYYLTLIDNDTEGDTHLPAVFYG